MKKLKIREEMDVNYQWNLSDIYTSDEDWKISYNEILIKLDDFSKHKGKLATSGEYFLKVLKKVSSLIEKVVQLYVYANMKHHQDTKNVSYQGLQNKALELFTKANTAKSFIDPEILEIGKETIDSFLESTPELQIYKHDLYDVFHRAKHTLPKEQEELLAKSLSFANFSNEIFGIINNNKAVFEPVLDKNGNKIEVTHGSFSKYISSNDRVLRENIYNSYLNYFISRKDELAGLYKYYIRKETFYSKARNYSSSIEGSLFQNNIPIEVYSTLLNTVNSRLDLLHKYISIRKNVLGLEKLKPFDFSVPIVEGVDYKVTYEEAKDIILKSLAPMGEEYVGIVKKILSSKWIDVYENKYKLPGAYSGGTYGTPPYILMNYMDDIRSLFTLTHELGHSAHSYYTRNNQPFVYGNYTAFLAEAASTIHESLLIDYLVKTAEDSKFKKYIINKYLTNFYITFFKQTMFAEFEKDAHKLVENTTLIDSSEEFSSIYKELLEKYFGPDFELDDKIIYEWVRIPHFYRSFYVYQYATGFASSVAIGKAILENKQGALEGYIEMLKSGSSDYSIPLLKKAGVDMTTSKPILDALDVFEELLNKFEND
ncbi:MAG: oligoendopeptidase F [Defluviitaleaceae bacterium]|nr:oligoendopeptidase F [Defluviitaleaceae bacterium]